MRDSFQSILDGIEVREGRAGFHAGPTWFQGRACYGGLVAAAGFKAMRSVVERARAPRSLQVTFVGPVETGEVELHVKCLRAGKSATVVETHVKQGDSVCTVLVGSFGSDRPSELALDAPARPAAKSHDEIAAIPYVDGLTPTFTQHFDYRYAVGGFPFSGTKERFMGGWCRFRDETAAVTHEHIVGLVDAWPPAVLPMMTAPAPGSSLTWTMQFLNWTPSARCDQWWFYQAEADAARGGYAQTRAVLWDPAGRPAALSSQLVTIFG